MHFSKTYAQLLSSLPLEFTEHTFEYRKLKQLINKTVFELDSLGIGPSVLHTLACLETQNDALALVHASEGASDGPYRHATITYEITLNLTAPEPRLRLSPRPSCDVGTLHSSISASEDSLPVYHVDLLVPEQLLRHITTTLHSPPVMLGDNAPLLPDLVHEDHFPDLIIPLPSDTAFFQLLTSTLSSLSRHFDSLLDSFNSTIHSLATSISSTALPASSSAPNSFTAYSLSENNVMSVHPSEGGKSDLYTWREIFHLYTQVQVFESLRESTTGERSIEDMEKQLKLFHKLIQNKRSSLVFPTSKDALDVFLGLNTFILDAKKFQFANVEATRKILKKHAKRTSLPIPLHPLERDTPMSTPFSRQVALLTRPANSLPRLLVQAIGEALLPIIPHIDDYSCLICTYVAFRPVRLRCGHSFCVRCLAKLQKRGKGNCPLCRAPTVSTATPANIDYGLLNFIADWFPIECREKMGVDQQELTLEQLETLGIADVRGCRIM